MAPAARASLQTHIAELERTLREALRMRVELRTLKNEPQAGRYRLLNAETIGALEKSLAILKERLGRGAT